MKQSYKDINFTPAVLDIITHGNDVIAHERASGFESLTARALYYKFIGQDLFPDSWIDEKYNRKHGLQPGTKNTLKNYKRLTAIISDARVAGLVDWDAIEDSTRVAKLPQEFSSLKELMDVALASYRLPRWEGQDEYVELWAEKDAIANKLRPISERWHVPLMINRGYSSQSAMRANAQRIIEATSDDLRSTTIIYVGDFDPSGEDMVRDIYDRLVMFGVEPGLNVEKAVLTWDQIQEHELIPNPAKITDSRAAKYMERYGDDSWELDALDSRLLVDNVEAAVKAHVNQKAMAAVVERENEHKKRLKKFVAKIH